MIVRSVISRLGVSLDRSKVSIAFHILYAIWFRIEQIPKPGGWNMKCRWREPPEPNRESRCKPGGRNMTRKRPRCVARWACLFTCFPIPVAYATGSSYVAPWAEDVSPG